MSEDILMTRVAQSNSLVNVLRLRAEHQPDRRAFVFLSGRNADEDVLDYAGLDRRARIIAGHLLTIAKPGDRILLFYPPCMEYISAFFGCLYAGMTAVPLYPPRANQKLFRVEQIVSNSGAQIALTSVKSLSQISAFFQSTSGFSQVRVFETDDLNEDCATYWREPNLKDNALAFLQYTSGSTGTPKGVMVSHRNLMANERAIQKGFETTADDVCMNWLPLYHDMGLIGNVLQPLYTGFPSILMPFVSFIQRPFRWLEAISKYKATVAGGPNFGYEFCVQKATPQIVESLDLSHWRVAYNGAEPVRAGTLRQFAKTFEPAGFRPQAFSPCYGMAEATLFITGANVPKEPVYLNVVKEDLEQGRGVAAEASDLTQELVGCGALQDEHELKIVDPETKAEVAAGQVGEIWFKGPSVADGYWNRPDATAHDFNATTSNSNESGFLRTGDLGFQLRNELYVTGRLKDLIIIRGRNFYPQDIETTAETAHEGLKKAGSAAFAVSVDGEEQVCILCEVNRSHRNADFEALFCAIRQAISESHDLTLYAIVLIKHGSLLKTSSGKVQRRACKTAFEEKSLKVLAEEIGVEAHRIHAPKSQPPQMPESRDQTTSAKPATLLESYQNMTSIQKTLVTKVAERLNINPDELDIHQPFARYGMDSAMMIGLSGDLEEALGQTLPPTLLYNYPTIASVTQYLTHEQRLQSGELVQGNASSTPAQQKGQEPIAIIGVGFHFPGIEDTEAFWALLQTGGDLIREVPTRRGEKLISSKAAKELGLGGFLSEIDCFDADFFGISPREAEFVDPQQRLLLEASHRALEYAAVAPQSLAGSKTGVFIGVSSRDYERLQIGSEPDSYSAIGTASSIAANRISYFFDLKGPSLSIDTACSSSLVALHYACKSLYDNESELALVGGVNLILDPNVSKAFRTAGMMSADGRCKAFDSRADGYVRSEGCGVVVLRRLSEAQRLRDPIISVIRGSAVNQDGRSNGLTAPSGPAQEAVVRNALANAGVAPKDVGYVEAHGTGTVLGDSIEFNALKRVYGEGRTDADRCGVGSVKTNLGHPESAAAMAGLIKTVLTLKRREIPHQLYLRKANPQITLDQGFYIPVRPTPWVTEGKPRLAGVHSFGFGGTNCHVILEEAPPAVESEDLQTLPSYILPLSALNQNSLRRLAQRYAKYIDNHQSTSLADLCYTAANGRSHYASFRMAVRADSLKSLRQDLKAYNLQRKTATIKSGSAVGPGRPKVAFLFSGLGTQYSGMGKVLYEMHPHFRASMEKCDALFQPILGESVTQLLYENTDTNVFDHKHCHASLFSLEYALAELLISWGILPDAMIGHGLGEFVAACISGVFRLEDGVKLVASMCLASREITPDGGMLVVFNSERVVRQMLKDNFDQIWIAALNGPETTVVSGKADQLDQLRQNLTNSQIRFTDLQQNFAYHTPMMEPFRAPFSAALDSVAFNSPGIPLYSNITGQVLENAPGRDYWLRHMCSTVRFSEGLVNLRQAGSNLFIEIGPNQVLSALATQIFEDAPGLPLLKAGFNDWNVLEDAVCALYANGVDVAWDQFYNHFEGRRVKNLPSYAFEKQSFWRKQIAAPKTVGVEDTPDNLKSPEPALQSRKDKTSRVKLIKGSKKRTLKITTELTRLISPLLRVQPDQVNVQRPFLEMGADSLVLVDFIRGIQDSFGIKIQVRQIFETLKCVADLADYLDEQLPPSFMAEHEEEQPAPAPASKVANPLPGAGSAGQSSLLAKLMDQHSQIMSQALSVIAKSNDTDNTETPQPPLAPSQTAVRPLTQRTDMQPEQKGSQYWASLEGAQLTEKQDNYLQNLARLLSEKTARSREESQAHRPILADYRVRNSFPFTIRNLLHPIIPQKASGSRMWDLDGNVYLDLNMDSGVSLLGHNPIFIREALTLEAESGVRFAPRSKTMGEAASLVCELTGFERIALCASGTMARALALRVIRDPQRPTLVVFDYFDNEEEPSLPTRDPDLLTLDFGDDRSLRKIRRHGAALSGVLIDPMAIRTNDTKAIDFLRDLRAITSEMQIPLLFDETVSGFRLHVGGAAAYFGVKPDLCIYGKNLAGGMNLGAVAGRTLYLNKVDGGMAQDTAFDFDSTEPAFAQACLIPSLPLAASCAFLKHLKAEGSRLHRNLNDLTAEMVERVNNLFAREEVPANMSHMGSSFRLEFSRDFYGEPFYYTLLNNGIYLRNLQNGYLSTQHTRDDLNFLILALEESIKDLRAGGFLPELEKPTSSVTENLTLDQTLIGKSKSGHIRIPATEAQKQLAYLAQLNRNALPAYTETMALAFKGPLRVQALERALRDLVERHQALRTHLDDKGVSQFILDEVPVKLNVVNLTGTNRDETMERKHLWMEENSMLVLEITEPPLFRFNLLVLEAQSHVLVLNIHHIIIDGSSLLIMIKELELLYSAHCRDTQPQLEPTTQYRDFMRDQEAYLMGLSREDEAYWKAEFPDGFAKTEPPADFAAPKAFSFKGNRLQVTLDQDLRERVEQMGQQLQCTSFMTYMGLFSLMLHRMTDKNEVLLCFPVSGRFFEGSRNMVGYSTHVVPFLSQIEPDWSMRVFMNRMTSKLLNVYEHQRYPFAKLIRLLDVDTSNLESGSVIPVTVSMVRQTSPPNMYQLSTEYHPTPAHFTKFNLHLDIVDDGNFLQMNLNYATDLFAKDTIERMMDRFQLLLEKFATQVDIPFGSVSLLAKPERRLILDEWLNTNADYPPAKCLDRYVSDQALRSPDAIALMFEDQTMTYGQLSQRASLLAGALRHRGVGAEVKVGLFAERSFEMMIGILGILEAGGAWVPLDPAYPADRLTFMLRDAGLDLALTQERLQSSFPDSGLQLLAIDRLDWQVETPTSRSGVTPEHSAYMIYTSGSTGRPKGVVNTHRGVGNRLQFGQARFAFSTRNRVMQKTPYSFDVSIWEMFQPLMAGATLVLAKPGGHMDPAYIRDLINNAGITDIHFVPSMLRAFLQEDGVTGCKSLEKVFCSGEALSLDLQAQFFKMFDIELHNLYGPTEAGIEVTHWPCLPNGDQRSVPIGPAIANTQLYILDKRLTPCPIGIPGELHIGGYNLARGYHGRADLTAEKFIPNPLDDGQINHGPDNRLYKTGDLTRFLPNGAIEYMGRLDHQVKLRGFRIELGEIESALINLDGVVDAVVIVHSAASGAQDLVAYIQAFKGNTKTPIVLAETDLPHALQGDQLKMALAEQLPKFMTPSSFVFMNTFPMLSSGKLNRRALPEPVLTGTQYTAPRTETEKLLAEIWREVLGVEQVGVYDNFFDIGGQSLLATQATSRIRKKFNVALSLQAIFEAPVLATFAKNMDETRPERQHLLLEPVKVTTEDPEQMQSFSQQRLWFLDQLEGPSPTYNMPFTLRMSGIVSIEALRESFNQMIARHQVLRAVFPTQQRQVIEPAKPQEIQIIDLSSSNGDQEWQRICREEANRPFDLKKGPLLRLLLLRLSDNEHILHLNMHHIVSDGWSLGVMLTELKDLYSAALEGRQSNLAPLPLQYGDFAASQHKWFESGRFDHQTAYWTDALSDAETFLQLPYDKPRPAVQSFRGAAITFQWEESVLAGLEAVARDFSVTPFMYLEAVFALLLSRYSGSRDILIGTPVANRSTKEFEQLVGFFVNSLVIRNDLSDTDGHPPAFGTLLKRVRQASVDAYANQDVPFEKVVERIQPERSMGYSPLFQVMFVLQNAPLDKLELPGVTVSLLEERHDTARFDLLLNIIQTGDLRGRSVMEYNTDLFEAATIRRMIDHFQTLLKRVMATPSISVARLSLLTEAEQRRMLIEWNNTRLADGRRCLHQMIEAQAAAKPNQPALSFPGRMDQAISYAELNRRADHLAALLRSQGVQAEIPVGIFMERRLEMVVSVLAVWKAGGAYLPLDPGYPSERLAYMLEDSQAPVLLTQSNLKDQLTAGAAKRILVDQPLPEVPTSCGPIFVDPANPAYYIYTSGSTGKPKGILMPHSVLSNLITWQNTVLKKPSRTLQFTSLSFDVSLQEIMATLSQGGELIMITEADRVDATSLLNCLRDQRVERLFLPFVALNNLADTALACSLMPTHLREIITAGEQLQITPAIENLIRSLDGASVHNHYGPAECHVVTTYSLDGEPGDWPRLPAVGKPIGNTTIYLLDRHFNPVPVGIHGELFIGGDAVSRGYHGRPGMSAEKFIPDPFSSQAGARLYRTGDMAYYQKDGNIVFIGRSDHQVKVRGYRIELGEIETALIAFEGIKEAVAVVRQTEAANKQIVAYICTASNDESSKTPFTISELREHLKHELPDYMIPAAFVSLPKLPLTPSGKVDQKALPAPEAVELWEEELTPPRTTTETMIAGIWCDILKRARVGVHSNFFELGGHSLMATQVISRINNGFSVKMPIRDLFRLPTVAEIADQVDNLRGKGLRTEAPVIQSLGKPQSPPLSFAQERLWFLTKMEGPSSTYNISTALRLKGALNIEALELGFNKLLRTHDSLRANFHELNGEATQSITPYEPRSLPQINLTNHPDPEDEARRLVDTELLHHFDLSNEPLVRLSLLKLGDEEHILILNIHHIISDGWSLVVFVRELTHVYEHAANGRPDEDSQPGLQYADYAAWQKQLLAGAVMEEQLNYWRTQLGNASTVLEFPTDRPRPAELTFNGGNCARILPKTTADGLGRLSNQHNASLFMTMLSALGVLLHRHAGQDDVIIGAPIAGRNHAGVEDMIGFFINLLPLRVDCGESPTFVSLLDRVRETTLSAYDHQDIPFAKLVEVLQPERDMSRNPFFQVALNMVNLPLGLELPDLKIDPITSPDIGSKFDMTLYVNETADGLKLKLDYNADLFNQDRMEDLLHQYELLLEQIIGNPSQPIGTYALITDRARMLLPDPTHELNAGWDGPIHTWFSRQVKRTPNHTAVSTADYRLTYSQLEDLSNQLARYLLENGLGVEDRVAVYGHRSPSLVVAVFGILKAGGAFVIVDPAYPVSRQLQFVELTEPRGLLQLEAAGEAPDAFIDAINGFHLVLPEGESLNQVLSGWSTHDVDVTVAPEHMAYVAFTSGSTGKPKGIMGRHGSLSHFMPWLSQRFGFGGADRFSMLSGIAHDPLQRDIFTPLALGGALCVPDPDVIGPGTLAAWARRQKISVAHLTPAMAQILTDVDPSETLNDLRYVFVTGDVLTRRDVHRIQAVAPRSGVVNFYGSTETQRAVGCFVVAGGQAEKLSESYTREAMPLGKGIPDVQLLILNEAGQPVGLGELGEIHLRSPHIANGYLSDEEQTAKSFLTNPFTGRREDRLYRTGDLGRYLPDGNAVFAGRRDFQVKIRGFRIETREIEGALATHVHIREAVVLTRDDTVGQKRLVAYVQVIPSKTVDEVKPAEIRKFLGNSLPDFMIPAAIVVLEQLPLTPNKKIDRRALPEPDSFHQIDKSSHVGPRNATEEMLAAIWQEVLGVERMGVHDNFFEAGGHSLIASRLIARVRNAFGIDLHLREIFTAPTISQLADVIRQQNRKTEGRDLPAPTRVNNPAQKPLSYGQYRLWFLDQLEDQGAAYNIFTPLRLKGVLDIEALTQAVNTILSRHQILRTTFGVQNNQPYQVVHEHEPINLQVITPEESSAQREAEVLRLAHSDALKPFDLSKGPLIRFVLLQIDEQDHLLQWTLHHIICDGWSIGLLISELTTLYRSLTQDTPDILTPLPIQYSDFCIWQRKWLSGEALEQPRAYWRNQLGDAPLMHQVPTDRPRPGMQVFEGAMHHFHLDKSLIDALHKLCRATNATLFMALEAAFAALLARYSGQDDIVIGTPVANRSHRETEPLIGLFVNTLALRNDLSGAPSFRQLLERTRSLALDAYANADLPFEQVVEVAQPERNLSHSPIFQIMFILHNTPPTASFELPDLTIQTVEKDEVNAKFDMTLNTLEVEDGLWCGWEYVSELFDAETIQRMSAHFKALLTSFAAKPETPVGMCSLLDSDERRRILVDWNDTSEDFPQSCIHQLFEDQAAKTPEATALLLGPNLTNRLTYAQLNHRANMAANHLRQNGVGMEDLVGVYCERDSEMLIALLAVLKSGAAYVPLDPGFPTDRLADMIEQSQLKALITQELLTNQLPRHQTQVIAINEDGIAIGADPSAEHNPQSEVTPACSAYVIYTSGSTGKPKGVRLTHEGVVNFLSTMAKEPGLSHQDTLLAVTTISFDIAVLELFLPLVTGAKLAIADRETAADGKRLIHMLDQAKTTVMQATPATWRLMLNAEWKGRKGMKILCGGEALQGDLATALLDRGHRLWNVYGPTETTIWSSKLEIVPKEIADNSAPASIGRPLGNTTLFIVDSYMQPTPAGVPGELLIGGCGLARGYQGRGDLTAERFIPNPFSKEMGRPGDRVYRTGDLTRYHKDGSIEFLGRMDHQVKVRGYRIELGEIEAALLSLDAVSESVVLVREDRPGDKRITAYLVMADPEVALDTIRDMLRSGLTEYMIPTAWVVLDEMPLTPNRKINRRALPAPSAANSMDMDSYVAPRNETEATLAEIWGKALGIEKVGIHHNFFELGGHSLMATQLLTRIRDAIGVELRLRDIFNLTTIELQAQSIDDMLAVQQLPDLERKDGDELEEFLL